jgi:hypothetical protein
LPLPSTRAKLDPWSPPDSAVPSAAAVAPMQTWGADPELDPKYNPEYGF